MTKITQQIVRDYILSLADASETYPFGEHLAVYSLGGKMFATIIDNKMPVNLSLKLEPELAKVLRNKYESVVPGHGLNQKYWNTLILTGQLEWGEVQDLISHSHELASEG